MNKKNKILPLRRMKWVFYLSAIVVIGSVMSFGAIGFYAFDFDKNTSVFMVLMILPMALIFAIGMYFILKQMEKRLSPLVNAIQEVSEGNMDISLNVKKAGEYELIYKGFNSMVKELKETKIEMQNFINEFTHEFKTPIASIEGFADYLYETGDEFETEERMEFLRIISGQAHRLSNLSQNTLLLSKVESCQIITEKEYFSLSEQIKSCIILLLKQIEEKGIHLDIAEEMDIDYYGNPELMEQIWINLLGNALKFTPCEGTIRINGKITDNDIEISIADSGIGMDEDTIEQIFNDYYQNDTTNIVKGNGIGLSITKRIIDLCEGKINIESSLNKGSTFTVVLPR